MRSTRVGGVREGVDDELQGWPACSVVWPRMGSLKDANRAILDVGGYAV
jgi:hypothetical protein